MRQFLYGRRDGRRLFLCVGTMSFNRCDFLLGKDDSVVIVIPAHLPKAETYTVSVSDHDIRFRAGYEKVAEMSYPGGDVFRKIANNTQVGLMEYPPDGGEFPGVITQLAYVEVRRSLQ